jgi:glycerol-3-phosphate dehydrogenase
VTRKYVLEIDRTPEVPPPVPIVGCKITTYRRLAEHTLRRLVPWFSDDVSGTDGHRNSELSFALVDRQRRRVASVSFGPGNGDFFRLGRSICLTLIC